MTAPDSPTIRRSGPAPFVVPARRTPTHAMARARALEIMHRPALSPWVVVMALVAVAAHVAVNAFTPYGIHRDELLYLAMGRHLRLFAMDFPPAIALVAEGTRTVLGEGLVALRLVPALAHGGIVLVAALIARAMDGGTRAQGLAAFAALTNLLFVRAGGMLQPVVLEQVVWAAALLVVVQLGNEATPLRWLALGALAGVALLVKFSALYFGFALAFALLLTPMRRRLATRWPWIALLLALVIGSPGVVGQVVLGFPVVGQMRDLQASQLARVTPAAFVLEQLLFGPATLLALAGAVALLRAAWAQPYRAAGWTAVLAFTLLLLLRGKSYYFGPMYPVLLAAGGVAVERMRRGGSATRWTTSLALAAYILLALPLALPFLAPAPMARYARALGITAATRTNQGDVLALPQDYADMLPWEAEVAAVSRAFHALPPAERADAVIVPDNYGQAGAIDHHGPAYGLPPAVLPSGSYWYFGPGTKPGRVVLTIGTDSADLAEFYDSVTVVETFTPSPYAVPEERDLPILVGRRPKATLQAIWGRFEGRN